MFELIFFCLTLACGLVAVFMAICTNPDKRLVALGLAGMTILALLFMGLTV